MGSASWHPEFLPTKCQQGPLRLTKCLPGAVPLTLQSLRWPTGPQSIAVGQLLSHSTPGIVCPGPSWALQDAQQRQPWPRPHLEAKRVVMWGGRATWLWTGAGHPGRPERWAGSLRSRPGCVGLGVGVGGRRAGAGLTLRTGSPQGRGRAV